MDTTGRLNLIRGQVVADIDRNFRQDRFPNGEDARPAHFATFNAATKRESVLENRAEIKHGGESPAVEHGRQLVAQLSRAFSAYVKETGREDVNMTVPESSGDEFA